MQKVRLRLTSAHTHTPPCLSDTPSQTKPLYAAGAVCSAGEEILLFFQRRSGEVKFHSFTQTSPGSGAPMATTYSKQMLYFSAVIRSSGLGPRERCRADLRAFVFLLLGCSSHRCFRGKGPTCLLLLWPYSSWKWAWFGCVFGEVMTPWKMTGNILKSFHWETPESVITAWPYSGSFIIFTTHSASQLVSVLLLLENVIV